MTAPARRPQPRRVPVSEPPPARFGPHDYADAFSIAKASGIDWTAEQWARTTLDHAPWAFRTFVPILWQRVVGFDLGPRPSRDHILGWRVVESTLETVELHTRSWHITAGVVFRVEHEQVCFTTFLRFDRPLPARVTWTALGPIHRFFVPRLLRWATP